MDDKRYDLVTATCMIVAVASALLFDHSGQIRNLVGLVGVAAGTVATVAYFRHQTPQQKSEPIQVAIPVLGQGVSLEAAQAVSADNAAYEAGMLYHRLLVRRRAHDEARWHDASGLRIQTPVYYMKGTFAANTFSIRNVPKNVFVEQVVEIVNRLAPTCEFDLHMDGKLTIKPKNVSGLYETKTEALEAASRIPLPN